MLGEVLEHVALERAVGVVEDPRERLRAAGRRRTRARPPPSACGAAPPRPAGSPARSSRPCARSAARCRAARRSGRRASTPRRQASCAGWRARARSSAGTRCAAARRSAPGPRGAGTRTGAPRVAPESRPSSSAARSGPSARSITSRAKSTPPARRWRRLAGGGQLAEDRVGRLGADRAEPRHLDREALDLVLAHPLDHVGGALGAERGHQHGRLARAADTRRAVGSGLGAGPAGSAGSDVCGGARLPRRLALLHPGAQLLRRPGRGRCRRAARPAGGSRRRCRCRPLPLAVPLPLGVPLAPRRPSPHRRAGELSRSSSDRRTAPRARAARRAPRSSRSRACAASGS